MANKNWRYVSVAEDNYVRGYVNIIVDTMDALEELPCDPSFIAFGSKAHCVENDTEYTFVAVGDGIYTWVGRSDGGSNIHSGGPEHASGPIVVHVP